MIRRAAMALAGILTLFGLLASPSTPRTAKESLLSASSAPRADTGQRTARTSTRRSVRFARTSTTAPSRASHAAASMPVPTARDWACIRWFESRGNYRISSGLEPYGGAYQFSLSTWRSLGGRGLPSQAPPSEQDSLALKLWRERGWEPWPESSRLCGL